MVRVLFLLLFVMSSGAFSQIDETPKPRKFDEFGVLTSGKLKIRMNAFFIELGNNPDAQGYIVNYGTDRETGIRERLIRDIIAVRRYDASRITFVRGGTDTAAIKTILWIIPPGAGHPLFAENRRPGEITPNRIPKGEAYRFEKLGRVSDTFFKNTFNTFFERVKNEKTINGYILIRGTHKAIAAFENKIRSLEFFESYNSDRIIFLKKPLVNTQATIALWVVPKSADLPRELNTK